MGPTYFTHPQIPQPSTPKRTVNLWQPATSISKSLAEQHAARAENAETRAAQETIARQKAEEELKRLQEQLAHLQART